MSAGFSEKKVNYIEKFTTLFDQYTTLLLVTCDNIGSNHMQNIRKELRGRAHLLMGKNTLMRKAIRLSLERNPQWASLLPYLVGNVGLVFTNDSLADIKKMLVGSRVPAAAKVGSIAPQDVMIMKGQTSLEPTRTSFLQALNIASKINKGSIEILNDVKLITAGEKVGSSQATLLQLLDIRPFTYGLEVVGVYDNGSMYEAAVLDLDDAELTKRFLQGVNNVAAVSLAAHIPTAASFPHVVINAYKNVLAVALASEISFPAADKLKDALKNPGAFAAAAAPAAVSSAPTKAAEPVVEEKEESEDMGFDLFG